MTQPTAELLQAIKGLAEKATKGGMKVMRVRGHNHSQAWNTGLCAEGDDADCDLLALIWNNLPTIIAALELKERVEKAGGYMLVNGNPLMPKSGGAAALKGPTNAG